MSARRTIYWFKLGLTALAVIAACVLIVFVEPIVAAVLAAGVWLPVSIGLTFGVACIVGWLRMEYVATRDVEMGR